MIEIAIGLVGFACGFVTSAVFAAQASRNAAEREEELRTQINNLDEGTSLYREANSKLTNDLAKSLERERSLRIAEAKRINHLRAIASSGGKARAAQRKKTDDL